MDEPDAEEEEEEGCQPFPILAGRRYLASGNELLFQALVISVIAGWAEAGMPLAASPALF